MYPIRLNQLLFASLIVLFFGVSQAAAQEIPLKGAFSGINNDFEGAAFPIGAFTGVFDPYTGTAEWTARRGTLSNQTISFVLVEEIFTNVYVYEQSVLFTGGTGRYDGISGSADFVGLINLANGAYFGLIDGVLIRN